VDAAKGTSSEPFRPLRCSRPKGDAYSSRGCRHSRLARAHEGRGPADAAISAGSSCKTALALFARRNVDHTVSFHSVALRPVPEELSTGREPARRPAGALPRRTAHPASRGLAVRQQQSPGRCRHPGSAWRGSGNEEVLCSSLSPVDAAAAALARGFESALLRGRLYLRSHTAACTASSLAISSTMASASRFWLRPIHKTMQAPSPVSTANGISEREKLPVAPLM